MKPMRLNRIVWAAPLLATALIVSSCGGGGGGGGGGGSNPPASTDDDARRAVLTDLGGKVILPALRDLDASAATLVTLMDAVAAAPADANAVNAAKAGWRSTMQLVQRAEVMQVGPATSPPDPNGAGLQMRIYSFPQFDACAIDTAAYTDQTVDANTPGDRSGMGAIEYLLFSASVCATPPAAGVDGNAKRAQHAARLARQVAAAASQLRTAWEPSGGNFLGQLSTAGAGSTAFSTAQDGLNAVYAASFYFEKMTKDRKIALPTGIGATGITCSTVSCPQYVESRFARDSGDHIRDNLSAFRLLMVGAPGGMGFNTLLEGTGRADVASRFVAAMNAAAVAIDGVPDFETAVAGITNRNQCVQASNDRAGLPQVCVMHGMVRGVTDILRTEVLTTLNLRIPDAAAGDND